MHSIFSDRIMDVPRSFIREILKATIDPTVISFAGGLPNRDLFPIDELRDAVDRVFTKYGSDVLQYSSTEGHIQLREYISSQYREKKGLDIPVEQILITNGSQQGLDLLGKIILDKGDGLIIEEPGYLGAIQAFSIYRPDFLPVPVNDQGINTGILRDAVQKKNPPLIYTVPNFQNPSGITYSELSRQETAEIIKGTNTILIEDDPYGELRYRGEPAPSFRHFLPDNSVLLGSFSKTVIPGFRLGWIVAPPLMMEKLITAKQAADLHTSHFTQSIIYQYLRAHNIEDHISIIRDIYGKQCMAMIESIEKHFPQDVSFTRPEGGMFLWATLPEGLAAIDLFDLAVKKKVVFVPGDPFYINKEKMGTMRLNFSCVDEETINTGIERLGNSIRELMTVKSTL